MADAVKVLQEQVAHLQKREAKLTRELAVERKRANHHAHQISQLTDAIRRGLPHMNLTPFLDDDPEPSGDADG